MGVIADGVAAALDARAIPLCAVGFALNCSWENAADPVGAYSIWPLSITNV